MFNEGFGVVRMTNREIHVIHAQQSIFDKSYGEFLYI
jgi:hypothetical protein